MRIEVSLACSWVCGLSLLAGCSADPSSSGDGLPDESTTVDGAEQALTGSFNQSAPTAGRSAQPWPLGFVVYEFDPAVYFGSDTALKIVGSDMRSARNDYGRDTSFLILEQKNAAVDHIYVRWTGGMQCGVAAGGESSVGKIGGNQFLCLGTAAGLRTALHETGHALGAFHEHARPDRDNFVTLTGTDSTSVNWRIETQAHGLGDFDGNSVLLYSTQQAPSGMTYRWKTDAIARQWNGPPASGQPVDRNIYKGPARLSLGDIRGLQVAYGDQFDASAAFVKGGTGKTPAQFGIFYRNPNGGVTHLFQSGSSFTSRDLGGSILGAPSAVFDGTNILVFGRSRVQGQNPKDGDLVGCFVDPNTHNRIGDWINVGRPQGDSVNGSPIAVAGTNDVYVQGAQRKIYRYNPGIGIPIWENVGGQDLKIAIDAVKQGTNTHVFGLRTKFDTRNCGSDQYCDPTWPVANLLAHRIRASNGTWSAWADVPDFGHVRGRPSVVSCTSTSVEVVVKGLGGDAWYQVWRQGSGWLAAWQALGGAVVGTPVAACHGSRLVVAATSTNGNVYLTWGEGVPGPNRFTPWWGWIDFGYALYGGQGSPMIASDGTTLEILARNLVDDVFRWPGSGTGPQFNKISTTKVSW